jgi:hypothetical protein
MRVKKNDLLSIAGMDKGKKSGLVAAGLKPTKKITFKQEYKNLEKMVKLKGNNHGFGKWQAAI